MTPALLAELRALHGAPGRAYHAWGHVESLLALHSDVSDRLADPSAIRLAILFHDAVYDPTRGDNEARSAELATTRLGGRVPAGVLDRVTRAILATHRHRVPGGLASGEASDIAHFLDMDLSVLGADAATFAAYGEGIRAEYAHVPDDRYRSARADVLARFLARDPLYLTPWGRDLFEDRARANLSAAIQSLGDAPAPNAA